MIYNYLNNRIHIDGDGKVPNGILVFLFDSTKLAHRMRNIFIFPNIPEKRCLFAQFPLKSVKNGKIWKCFWLIISNLFKDWHPDFIINDDPSQRCKIYFEIR